MAPRIALVESFFFFDNLSNSKGFVESRVLSQNHKIGSNFSAKDKPENDEYNTAVSSSEQILLRNLKRVVIRGKRGGGASVLFSKDV
jgi:hypothetical protein